LLLLVVGVIEVDWTLTLLGVIIVALVELMFELAIKGGLFTWVTVAVVYPLLLFTTILLALLIKVPFSVAFKIGARVRLESGTIWAEGFSLEPVPLDESLAAEFKSSILKLIDALPEGG